MQARTSTVKGGILVQPVFKRKRSAHLSIAAAAGALGLLCASSAGAATATGSFNVTMTINGECVLQSAGTVAFPASGVLSTAKDATGTLSVQCTNSLPYTVALDAGTGAGATTAARKMSGAGGSSITYSLYRDAARTLVWGSTAGTDTAAGTGTGSAQSLTVYGRAPSQSTPAAGSYADTIQVTITY